MTSVHDLIPEVSIVVPIYNEFNNLPDLVARIDAAMRTQPLSYELIAVDDGSNDGSAQRLREISETHPWVRAVCLVRNYGQSSALQAGFDRVRGRYVVTLDADLQNEPGDIPLLLERLENEPDLDMISGWRKNRQDKALSRRLPSVLANRLISKLTNVQLHDYGCALK
ncbi:MAG: glycosyltransferase family 2 protein, partial [Comamonas sp.]